VRSSVIAAAAAAAGADKAAANGHDETCLSGGHYIAYCQSHITGEWFEFDDRHVTRVPEEEISKQQVHNGCCRHPLSHRRYGLDFLLASRMLDENGRHSFRHTFCSTVARSILRGAGGCSTRCPVLSLLIAPCWLPRPLMSSLQDRTRVR